MDLPTFTSIGPEIWGRPFWEFLDAIVATYPKENPTPEHRQAVLDLMNSLKHLLPCPVCRHHYVQFVGTHPLENALASRKTLMDFYFLLKKDVASRTGKGYSFKSPSDLWEFIIRRFKLVRINPQQAPKTTLQTTNPRQTAIRSRLHRITSKSNNALLTPPTVKKGCGCGKH